MTLYLVACGASDPTTGVPTADDSAPMASQAESVPARSGDAVSSAATLPTAGQVPAAGTALPIPSAAQDTTAPVATAPPIIDTAVFPPQRVRRLSNRELGNSIRALLGTETDYEHALPKDVRQGNFTVNEAQVTSSDWGAELANIAQLAAADAGPGLEALLPCSDGLDVTEACARGFIEALATRAFRRPPQATELDELWAVYETGVAEAGSPRGFEVVVAAVVQSPSFVYLTELGDGDGHLTEYEIASLLAYATTQSPPDSELLRSALEGQLADALVREQQARRLLASEPGKSALAERVVQWFGADTVVDVSKDDVPEFNLRRQQLLEESRDFARAVIESHGADVVTLLTADFTVASKSVAEFYGLEGEGQVSLLGTPRRGLLTQAAFLGGHAKPSESSPIRRGAAFLRQVLCTEPPDPADVGLAVTPPAPDPALSTRQLFEAHSADELCRSCHNLIDPFGFAFEEFDEAGRVRQGAEDNNGHPIDAAGSVTVSGETFDFDNAAELLEQVAQSELAQRCVAKTTVRYALGAHRPETEEAFVELWRELAPERRTRLDEVLVALITSDLFVRRGAP